MYLGIIQGKICRTSTKAPNQSVYLTGLSGSGKTSRLNLMEYTQAKEGGTVIILDMNQSHSDNRIFSDIREEYLGAVQKISLSRDGIGDGLLNPMIKENDQQQFVLSVNAAVQALSSGQDMGIRQKGVLRKAVIDAMKFRTKFKTEAEAIEFALLDQDDDIASTVYEKMWTLIKCGALKPASKTMLAGKVNILGFSGADAITQSCLAEIFLTKLWRQACTPSTCSGKQNLVVVLDEFQNLSLKADAILPNLLREGRKYGINLLLATQSLEIFPAEVLAMLNQSATKLYFRQTQDEARRIARKIDEMRSSEWAKKLANLRVGEAVAIGNLCVDGRDINRPLLLK